MPATISKPNGKMPETNADDRIRTTHAQIRALANVHSGTSGAVKEVYANGVGYATEGVTPYVDAILKNEKSVKGAYLYFISHSFVDDFNHIFDIGHRSAAVVGEAKATDMAALHRKFNAGTYITAGKVCMEGKEGMIVVCWDPYKREGKAGRAFINEEGYVCRVSEKRFTVSADGSVSFWADGDSGSHRDEVRKLWLGTQWETRREVDSHRLFCEMVQSHVVAHAQQGKRFATTMFMYTDLKTAVDERTKQTVCFLRSTDRDILPFEEPDDSSLGFRKTIREHFMPYVNGCPGMKQLKKRSFYVMGVPITQLAAAVGVRTSTLEEESPWCAKVAALFNEHGGHPQSNWYPILGGKVRVKFVRVPGCTPRQIYQNWWKYARAPSGANEALPVGTVMIHGDKVMNKTPFAVLTGQCFQEMPPMASKYESLVNVMLKQEMTPSHVDELFLMLGMPDARLEQYGATPEICEEHRARNAKILFGHDTGSPAYRYVMCILVKPSRSARRVVDVDGLQLDETRVNCQYLRLDTEAGQDASSRLPRVALLGLDTAAIVQVENLDLPLDKERLLADAESRKFYQELLRCLVHHNLTHVSEEIEAVRKSYLEAWHRCEEDKAEEERRVQYIKHELQRQADAKEAKRIAAEQRAAAAKEEAKRVKAQAAAQAAAAQAAAAAATQNTAAEARRVAREEAKAEREAAENEKAKARQIAERLRAKEQKQEAKREKQEAAQLEADRKKREAAERKAERTRERESAAQSAFAIGVIAQQAEFGLPDGRRTDAATIKPGGDIFPRMGQSKATERINDTHQWLEAAGYCLDHATLRGSQRRKLNRSLVTPEVAYAMLESLLQDGMLPRALEAQLDTRQTKVTACSVDEHEEAPLSSRKRASVSSASWRKPPPAKRGPAAAATAADEVASVLGGEEEEEEVQVDTTDEEEEEDVEEDVEDAENEVINSEAERQLMGNTNIQELD